MKSPWAIVLTEGHLFLPAFLQLLLNCCAGLGLISPIRSPIHMEAPNVCIPEKWALHGQVCIGQIQFLPSSSFCLKTDLKHLENLSIELKCSSAFFLETVGSHVLRLMDFSTAIYSHFPRAPQSLAKQRSSVMAPITMCSLCERIQGEELG